MLVMSGVLAVGHHLGAHRQDQGNYLWPVMEVYCSIGRFSRHGNIFTNGKSV